MSEEKLKAHFPEAYEELMRINQISNTLNQLPEQLKEAGQSPITITPIECEGENGTLAKWKFDKFFISLPTYSNDMLITIAEEKEENWKTLRSAFWKTNEDMYDIKGSYHASGDQDEVTIYPEDMEKAVYRLTSTIITQRNIRNLHKRNLKNV